MCAKRTNVGGGAPRLLTREDHEEREAALLAPLATRSRESRGRRYDEAEHPLRTVFQRDRDRVVHSVAFRRLEYKTQVFVNHEGDYYRTRLTHTLEVSQLSRTIARIMGLNEDLAEAIALAHDVGHTPFGHSGEEELDAQVRNVDPAARFEHNRHGLRVVDVLERRYPTFPGLNLSYEVREAMDKHTTRHDHPHQAEFDDGTPPVLEAQGVEMADEIAYNNHDLDDGLTAGLVLRSDLEQVAAWARAAEHVDHVRAGLPPEVRDRQIIIQLINRQVTDLVQTTMARIRDLGIGGAGGVRAAGHRLFRFSDQVEREKTELEEFLRAKLYHHYRVVRMTNKAKHFIRKLFQAFLADERQLPDAYQPADGHEPLYQAICDYIAGMTDRFALDEYQRLFEPYERV